MKRFFLFFVLLTMGFCSFSQTLKLQLGTSYSMLDWKVSSWDAGFDKSLFKFSGSIGLDYFDKKNFNLSSNIGFLTKGGRGYTDVTDENGISTGSQISKLVKLNYVSVNTCIDFKYPVKNVLIPYLSVGPRIDYLVSHNSDFDGVDHKNISYGLLTGAGIKYNFTKVQLGLRADYLVNFNKIAKWSAQSGTLDGSINDQTILYSVTIGYKL